MIEKWQYKVRFLTPAFLGDIEQSGRWRTPPFKALLRQWWRVVYAVDHNFNVDVAAMRREEGLLFGNAWLSHREGNKEVNDYSKSLVRIRLDRWDAGDLKKTQWPTDSPVSHPEVRNRAVGNALYLGYGPLTYDNQNRTTTLKANAAIQAGESSNLSIVVPDKYTFYIKRAFWLIDRYGTLGGRSRNGWGSIVLEPLNGSPLCEAKVFRLWHDALKLDWPHAIGRDDEGRPLIWQTREFEEWRSLMRELAVVKIGLRTQFVFPSSRPPHADIERRHWLSYPITTHTTNAWDRSARLPNSLRFKIRPAPQDPVRLVGVIFHMPCLPPADFKPDTAAIKQTWQSVHALLDELCKPLKERRYASISDRQRRNQLEQQLNTVTLHRVQE